jgi:type II secretory pathway component PulF
MLGAWAAFEERIIRLQFGDGTRIEFYETLQILIENRVSINDALKELYSVWSNNGKSKSAALAVVTHDLMQQLSNGAKLSSAIARWAPYEEVSLIAAGEKAGRLVAAFDDAVRVITAKQKIRSALMKATVYPTFLGIPLVILLWIISTKMVPSMARQSDPAGWSGAAYGLYLLSSFVTNYGVAAICLLVGLAIAIVFSFSRLTGSIRIYLDKWPFYSTYRMIHGSTFLLNLAVMMRAGISLYDALKLLHQYANPYMRERIQGAMYGIRQGANLGVALGNAGHGFPDKRAIQFIRILASREGFSESINKYSERWLMASIKRIEMLATVSLNSMLIVIGLVMALVVMGTQGMTADFEKSANHATQKLN